MYASNSHSYTHLILALGIVREPSYDSYIPYTRSCIRALMQGMSIEVRDFGAAPDRENSMCSSAVMLAMRASPPATTKTRVILCHSRLVCHYNQSMLAASCID